MDKVYAYLKSNPERAAYFAQAWEELLAEYPQLVSLRTQEQWNQFQSEHQGLNLDDNLWIYGPLSLEDEIQEIIARQSEVSLTDEKQERDEKEKQQQARMHPIIGYLMQKNTEGESVALFNATITITDIKDKRKVETLHSDSRGYFKSRVLLPYKRYLLVIRHPILGNKEKKRVINMKAFQPPLRMVFGGKDILHEKVSEEKEQLSQQDQSQRFSMTVDDRKNKITPSQQENQTQQNPQQVQKDENAIPFTERAGFSTDEETFSLSGTSKNVKLNKKVLNKPFDLLKRSALTQQVNSELEREVIQLLNKSTGNVATIWNQLLKEQRERWESDSGKDFFSSNEGADYNMGSATNPHAPTLAKDALALFKARYPKFYASFLQQAKEHIYQEKGGAEADPEIDPIFKTYVYQAEQAGLYAKQNGLDEDYYETILPFYIEFARLYPLKAQLYAPHSVYLANALRFIEEGKTAATVAQKKNFNFFTQEEWFKKVAEETEKEIENQVYAVNQELAEEEKQVEQAQHDYQQAVRQEQSQVQQAQIKQQQLQKQVHKEINNTNTLKMPRRRMPLREMGGRGASSGGRGVSSMTSRMGKMAVQQGAKAGTRFVVAFFLNPASPGFWIMIVLLLIIIILLILFGFTPPSGETTVRLTKSGPEAVPNKTEINYELQVSYTNASQVIVKDVIAENAEFVSAGGPGNPVYDPATRTVTWTILGSGGLNSGTSSATLGENLPPNNDTCGGKYNLSTNTYDQKNFGDPGCTLANSPRVTYSFSGQTWNNVPQALIDLLTELDPNNVGYWIGVIACEAPGFDPNNVTFFVGSTPTPDSGGAWGLFQMGRSLAGPYQPGDGLNGAYDRGDVNWQNQVNNAVNYNKKIGGSWRYWACASMIWGLW